MRRAAILLVFVVFVSACGGKPFPRATPTVTPNSIYDTSARIELTSAVRATLAARTAQTSFTVAAPSGTSLATGVIDFHAHASRLTTNTSTQEASGKTVHYASEARVLNGILYYKYPPELAKTYGSPRTPWISTDLTQGKLNGHTPVAIDLLALVVTSPQNGTTLVTAGAPRKTYTGRIALLGVSTTLPRDLRAFISNRIGLAAEILRLVDMVGTNPSFVATVDGEGRLASVALTSTVPGVQTSLVLGFLDFGVPVHVSPPPKSQVSPAAPGLPID